MAIVNRSFSVNVTPGMMPPIVHVSEYDVGRAYTVSILDEQGNTFTIPSGTTASVEGTLNGSVGFTQSATVSNNQVSFTLSESMTAYSGKAWCKIKLTQNSQPIQTCAFVLAVDRAGVEAETILHSPGFQEQINEGIAEYFDNDPPFFELPDGGQSGQALLSDGADGAYWGEAQGGSGLTEDVKQALLDCFKNVAWINDQGQTYYDALYDVLFPPASLVSISAVFSQGQNVVREDDSLNTLRQYLTVTARYSDSSTKNITSYGLSGALTAGISTVTVSYGGKMTTFNVNVTASSLPSEYQKVDYIESTGTQYFDTNYAFTSEKARFQFKYYKAARQSGEGALFFVGASGNTGLEVGFNKNKDELFAFSNSSFATINSPSIYGNELDCEAVFSTSSPYATISAKANGIDLYAEKTVANKAFTGQKLNFFHTSTPISTRAIARLYYARVYDGDSDSPVLDLVPCYRKNDNVAGMYDIVNGVFYSSPTDNFAYGGER